MAVYPPFLLKYLCGVEAHPVILFDGVCNFCNGVVNFIIRRDRKRTFRYAALQSETGQRLLQQYGLPATDFDSFVLIDNGKAYIKSAAALRLYSRLGGAWKLLNFFRVFPPLVRNAAYDLVARNRYKWFGKKESCMIPGPEIRSLFLE